MRNTNSIARAASMAFAIGVTMSAAPVLAQTIDTARIEAGGGNDWPTYHGNYKSYHYSTLDQINSGNVKDLQVAWMHFPGRSTRGVQSQPIVADGVIYYTGSYSRVFALNGATGELIWSYFPELDDALVARQTHSPYNRGTAMGDGKLYVATVGGNDDDTAAKKTWGNDSWRTGGGGGWMPGTFDTASNTIWWGTANPGPLYDWSGADYMTKGARPGDNLYTTSVIGLDVDTGALKFYHQELPHDAWDFDSAVGEFISIDRDGKQMMVHPNKSGFIFVYNRKDATVENVWRLVENINFVKDITPKGELIGRRDFTAGKQDEVLCPHISGGVSWNSGSYDPKNGVYYKLGQEWCMKLNVVKTAAITEPQAQLNIGANFSIAKPPSGEISGHLDARDPITGAKKWEVSFPEPPLSSVLSTAGNLVFVPDARGVIHAYNSIDGKELWSHNDGTGHQGGIVSYSAGGKQYIAVVAGFGGMATDDYSTQFGEPYKSMPKDTGALIVFGLK